MVLDALEQALHDRGMPKNVIHHSDRGVQYLSIRYTNRLEAANLRASVGTTGDSYDNALAETVNGLYCQRHSKIDPFYLTNGKVKLTPLISY